MRGEEKKEMYDIPVIEIQVAVHNDSLFVDKDYLQMMLIFDAHEDEDIVVAIVDEQKQMD